MDEAAAKVHFLLQDASFRQTVSDVPSGMLLSGGIDSCAITHFVCKKLQVEGKNVKEFQTFSLGLPNYTEHFKVNDNQITLSGSFGVFGWSFSISTHSTHFRNFRISPCSLLLINWTFVLYFYFASIFHSIARPGFDKWRQRRQKRITFA